MHNLLDSLHQLICLAQAATFPESSLSHLLCNKQFFFEASRVWAASKVVTCEDSSVFQECMGHFQSMDLQVLQHITEIRFTSTIFDFGARQIQRYIPRLARLSVRLLPRQLELENSTKICWEDDFTDAELAKVPLVSRRQWRA